MNASQDTQTQNSRFISLRWRFLSPLAIILIIVAMVGAYLMASQLSQGLEEAETAILLQSLQTTAQRAHDLYEQQRSEALRLAYTRGIPEAVESDQISSLARTLETAATAAGLDSIIITNAVGLEVAGLVHSPSEDDYAISTGTDLSDEALVQQVLSSDGLGASGIMRTTDGLMIYAGMPIEQNNQTRGAVLVGHWLDAALLDLSAGASADIALYDAQGQLLQSSFRLEDATLRALAVDGIVFRQISGNTASATVAEQMRINGVLHRTAYAPLDYGSSRLGIMALFMPSHVPYATEVGRQMVALLVAALAGTAVVMVFFSVDHLANRVERVAVVADELAQGKREARTGMKQSDEVGVMGAALDRLADASQAREETLEAALRRQRRERSYLVSVLSAMPDGIVVQDNEGRVMLMNETARQLLGAQSVSEDSQIMGLTPIGSGAIGQSLAPGLYALGDPRRLQFDGRMIHAQAAAMTSATKQRLGTVVVVRDISDEVRQEQQRDQLLERLSAGVQQPLAHLAQDSAAQDELVMHNVARQISRHAASLQKMIIDMRELTRYGSEQAEQQQRPLALETLIWAVANDWRQIAQAAELSLQVLIDRKSLFVLGDESRLRWALGNILDNAIKYTPAGGLVSLEVQASSDQLAHLRVRDNGVGITPDELPHVFMRFYRGTPVTGDGRYVNVPGMGQGLTDARQIIDAHGGLIRVKSKPGVGTAVYMGLPLTEPAGYALPIFGEDTMQGETIIIPEDVDVDRFWQQRHLDRPEA